MFIAVYEFVVKEGRESEFRSAWLEVTQGIYKYLGSLGSRLHTTDQPNIMIAYAQWPNRKQWEQNVEIDDVSYNASWEKMRDCLIQSKTVYKLDVCDDFLQTETH